mmetsp:Transcript_30489/g.105347  ORF Transcript_30489/g.105347 Transcript_30489/m.105347 type:complete len:257 (+) Transcript_30489:781-1551(+)
MELVASGRRGPSGAAAAVDGAAARFGGAAQARHDEPPLPESPESPRGPLRGDAWLFNQTTFQNQTTLRGRHAAGRVAPFRARSSFRALRVDLSRDVVPRLHRRREVARQRLARQERERRRVHRRVEQLRRRHHRAAEQQVALLDGLSGQRRQEQELAPHEVEASDEGEAGDWDVAAFPRQDGGPVCRRRHGNGEVLRVGLGSEGHHGADESAQRVFGRREAALRGASDESHGKVGVGRRERRLAQQSARRRRVAVG